MDARSIGTKRQVRELNLGECILFYSHTAAALGIVVQSGENSLGILHVDAVREGKTVPAVYNLSNFYNETCLLIESARIVPILSLDQVGFGRPSFRHVSPVLFIEEEKLIMGATIGDYFNTYDLLTGKASAVQTDRSVYTKAWHIEVIDQDGSFTPFYEMRVEA